MEAAPGGREAGGCRQGPAPNIICSAPHSRPLPPASACRRPRLAANEAGAGGVLGGPWRRPPPPPPRGCQQPLHAGRQTSAPGGRPCLLAPAPASGGRPWRQPLPPAAAPGGSPCLRRQTLAADPGGRRRTLAAGSGVGGPDPVRRGGSPRQADPAPAQL